jgi:hypothetical protein
MNPFDLTGPEVLAGLLRFLWTRRDACSRNWRPRAPQPLTVILEPDGAYPPIEHLLRQLDRALEEGRAGLSESECEALVAIDRTGLEMAATSFARKREKQRPKRDRESGVGVNTWPCTRSISACCRSWRSRRLCCSSWPVNVLSTIRR